MGESVLDRIIIRARGTGGITWYTIEKMLAESTYTDLWATQRPLTGHWGSGEVLERLTAHFGPPDIIFGKQDQVNGFTVDRDPETGPSVVADWSSMPMFKDRQFKFGYWDPPYLANASVDKKEQIHFNLLEPCLREICRVLSTRLAVLHPMGYENPLGWHKVALYGVTFGPKKMIRELCVWERDGVAKAYRGILPPKDSLSAFEG